MRLCWACRWTRQPPLTLVGLLADLCSPPLWLLLIGTKFTARDFGSIHYQRQQGQDTGRLVAIRRRRQARVQLPGEALVPRLLSSPADPVCVGRSTRASFLRSQRCPTRDWIRGRRRCRRRTASSTSRRTRSCAPTRARREGFGASCILSLPGAV